MQWIVSTNSANLIQHNNVLYCNTIHCITTQNYHKLHYFKTFHVTIDLITDYWCSNYISSAIYRLYVFIRYHYKIMIPTISVISMPHKMLIDSPFGHNALDTQCCFVILYYNLPSNKRHRNRKYSHITTANQVFCWGILLVFCKESKINTN